MGKDDHGQIFDFLDNDKNGHISVAEFHSAIEATAPIRTVLDLRKKWIALGYHTMWKALENMGWRRDSNEEPAHLNMHEFCKALERSGITDPSEAVPIFLAIQADSDRSGYVTLDQLHAAIAAVSPPLLLEVVRHKFVTKFGSIEEAHAAICMEGPGKVPRKTFCR